MSGFMDLRRPRVARRSNFDLVVFCCCLVLVSRHTRHDYFTSTGAMPINKMNMICRLVDTSFESIKTGIIIITRQNTIK